MSRVPLTKLIPLTVLLAAVGAGAAASASGSGHRASPPFPPTELVSRVAGANGAGADRGGDSPSISADGRYVAFASAAGNLGGPNPGRLEVYRRDMDSGALVLVSRADGAAGAVAGFASSPSISADGRYVAFSAPGTLAGAGESAQVYVRDLNTQTTTLVSRASGAAGAVGESAHGGVISADGRHVAFISTGVLTPDAYANSFNAYVRDLDTNVTENVLKPDAGAPVSTPGGTTAASYLSISADGTRVAYSTGQPLAAGDDAEGSVDVYVRDRVAGTTKRITPPGTQTPCRGDYPSISANGNFVAYEACDGRITVTDLTTGTSERVSEPIDVSGPGTPPSISADGSRIAYMSVAEQDSPVKGSGKNVFVVNRNKGVTVNASRASGAGVPANAGSNDPQIADAGGFVAFTSRGGNLSSADADNRNDVFRRQLSFAPDRALPVCGGRTVTQLGTNRRDVIVGTERRDVIDGMGGNDVIKGMAGADILCGGAGKDRVNGGADNTGSSPYDRLFGGPGGDHLKLVEGGGSARGGPGNDVVVGSDTNDSGDSLSGGLGNDVLRGLGNADYNPDTLRGGPGNDDLFGGADEDYIYGQRGDDRLFGGPGDDLMRGGPGRDLLDYGPGERLTG